MTEYPLYDGKSRLGGLDTVIQKRSLLPLGKMRLLKRSNNENNCANDLG